MLKKFFFPCSFLPLPFSPFQSASARPSCRKSAGFSVFLLPLLVLSTMGTSARAQDPWLEKPLRAVPADSVMTWSYTGADFRQTALAAEPMAQAPTFSDFGTIWKQKDAYAEGCRELLVQLNPAGGGDDEMTQPQGVPALVGLQAANFMLRATGQAAYADYLERAIFNAAPHTLADSTLKRGTPERLAAAMVLMAAPGLLYATDEGEENLYVNFYTNATARLRMGGRRFMLDQITDMPADGRVKFRFTQMATPLPLTVRLRMPDWTTRKAAPCSVVRFTATAPALPRVYVNGHEMEEAKADTDGYLHITREWRSGDEIYLDFDLTPQFIYSTARPSQLALQCGPLLYAVTSGLPASAYTSAGSPPTPTDALSATGATLLSGKAFLHGAPQDAAAPEVTYQAAPYREVNTGRLWTDEIRPPRNGQQEN